MPTPVKVGATLSFLLSDGLGSVQTALDGSGHASARALYAPYGGARYTNGTMPTAKAFTGQYGDVTSGLDYYNARYYDPALGQFTSADGDARGGLNHFNYVLGNPETATDPTGHSIYCGDGECSGGASPSAPLQHDPCYSNCGAAPVQNVPSKLDDPSPCYGVKTCFILIGGPDPSLFQKEGSISDQKNAWNSWITTIEGIFGTVGIILFDAVDAVAGADRLHDMLKSLAGMGETITLIGHSNGAAAIFQYFADRNGGDYGGDAAVRSFIALDAPTDFSFGNLGSVEDYHGQWFPQSVLTSASQYVSGHHIVGVYAYNQSDWLSGSLNGVHFGLGGAYYGHDYAWTEVSVNWHSGSFFEHWVGDHVYLKSNPEAIPNAELASVLV